MKFIVDQQVEDIELPENLKLNTFLQEFHSDCPHPECSFGFYGFAFGQSPFPIPEKIVEALKNHAHRKEYLPIQGLPKLREAISNYLQKRLFTLYLQPL